jgi:hypothetical protein
VKPGKPIHRRAHRSPVRRTGPSPATVRLVFERDNSLCAFCGFEVSGTRGWDFSVQHRLRRGAGGTRRDLVNMPSNLILLHGSATTRCHNEVEQLRKSAAELGYRVVDGKTAPRDAPVLHAGHGGWVLLDDCGGWKAVDQP